MLASAYRESLRVAEELGAATVAFPAVSAGVYGWPMDDAARIAVETVRAHDPVTVREVRFVLFGPDAYAAFTAALAAADHPRSFGRRRTSPAACLMRGVQ